MSTPLGAAGLRRRSPVAEQGPSKAFFTGTGTSAPAGCSAFYRPCQQRGTRRTSCAGLRFKCFADVARCAT